MLKLELQWHTGIDWVQTVLNDFDRFLQDHAAAEKKAAGMATSMLSHYPDRSKLVNAMAELAVEEMMHFREVIRLLLKRDSAPGQDEKDPYVHQLRNHLRKGSDDYFLDRLLLGAVIEARGAERFGLIAEHAPDGELKTFYQSLARSEARHYELFTELALEYFDTERCQNRLNEWLSIEAGIASKLPLRPCLH